MTALSTDELSIPIDDCTAVIILQFSLEVQQTTNSLTKALGDASYYHQRWQKVADDRDNHGD